MCEMRGPGGCGRSPATLCKAQYGRRRGGALELSGRGCLGGIGPQQAQSCPPWWVVHYSTNGSPAWLLTWKKACLMLRYMTCTGSLGWRGLTYLHGGTGASCAFVCTTTSACVVVHTWGEQAAQAGAARGSRWHLAATEQNQGTLLAPCQQRRCCTWRVALKVSPPLPRPLPKPPPPPPPLSKQDPT